MDRVSIIALVVGSVLPLLTTSVTKASWPEWIKQVLLALLSALTGVGVAMGHDDAASATVIIANGLTTFATAVAVAAGTWRPTGALARLESMFVRDAPAAAATVTSIAETLASRSGGSPTKPTGDSS